MMKLLCCSCSVLVLTLVILRILPCTSVITQQNESYNNSSISVLTKSLLSTVRLKGVCENEVTLAFLQRQNTTTATATAINNMNISNNKKNQIPQTDKKHRSSLLRTAVCFHSNNLMEEAMSIYNYIRKFFPDYAFPLVNIALIYLKNSQPLKVVETLDLYFEEVGGFYGDFYGDDSGGGTIHREERKLGSSIPTPKDYDAQIVGPPCLPYALNREECVNALNFYGIAQVELYDYTKAMRCYQRAIEIGSDVYFLISDVYENIGTLYDRMGFFDEAADSFLKSFWTTFERNKKTEDNNTIDLVPLIQRAMLVPSISSSLEESILFKEKFERRILDLLKLIEYGGVGLEDDSSDLFRVQSDISNMNHIQALPPLEGSFNYHKKRLNSLHFYLQYYGFHDRPLQELVMKMIQKISHPSLFVFSPIKNQYPSLLAPTQHHEKIFAHNEAERSKLRVVFISSHFGGNEPHGMLLIDVIRRLPSRFFECIAIGTGAKEPSQAFIEAVKGNYHGIGTNDHHARELLHLLRPDCLIFGEVMNDGLLFFLAQTRFAPLQVLVMGAPVTSGFSTIDYFLSGDRLENPFRTQMSGDLAHREHYTEQVVLFDGQAISFPFDEPHPKQNTALARGDAIQSVTANFNNTAAHGLKYDSVTGLPIISKGSIYLCFQNLFKIHPVFDSVIIKLLHADEDGHVVLQAARDHQLTLTLKRRIQTAVAKNQCRLVTNITDHICDSAQKMLSRIHFIPRVPSDVIKKILENSTIVVLHPFPFGGSKTASDTLRSGVPLVTYPQPYLRGRLASTFYTTMALHEVDEEVGACCIARDIGDYVAKALRLGRDNEYRQRVSNAIMKQNHRIFDDVQTSYEWARFLSRALGVVLGEKELALEMDYIPKRWQVDSFLQDEFILGQQQWKSVSTEHFILR